MGESPIVGSAGALLTRLVGLRRSLVSDDPPQACAGCKSVGWEEEAKWQRPDVTAMKLPASSAPESLEQRQVCLQGFEGRHALLLVLDDVPLYAAHGLGRGHDGRPVQIVGSKV